MGGYFMFIIMVVILSNIILSVFLLNCLNLELIDELFLVEWIEKIVIWFLLIYSVFIVFCYIFLVFSGVDVFYVLCVLFVMVFIGGVIFIEGMVNLLGGSFI